MSFVLEKIGEGKIQLTGSSTLIILIIIFVVFLIKDFKDKSIDRKSLLNHELFNYLNYSIKVLIPSINFKCPGRTIMVRDFLYLKYSEVLKSQKELVLNFDFVNKSKHELKLELTNIIADTVIKYETEALLKGIPNEFIESFNQWHKRSMSYIDKVLYSFSNISYYNNYEYMDLVMTVIYSVMISTFEDAKTAIDHMNGQLTGKIYKGITIK